MSQTWVQYRQRRRRSRIAAAALSFLTAALVALLGWFFLRGQFGLPGSGQGPSQARVYDPAWMKPVRAPRAVPAEGALALLESLPVAPKDVADHYQRTAFGQAWADEDRNGCDTRNDVLRRDLDAVTFTSGSERSLCRVATGELWDPYTGKRIAFRRGERSSQNVQIDHVVALGEAWKSGAARLSPGLRQTLANDPLNLLAVDGPANQQKSAQDASTWLPANRVFRCHYVARQISVKYSYGLSVGPEEKAAMRRVLGGCPEQQSISGS
ncbi:MULTISPECIES: HNH endonuclease family protein [Arthrobacter]|uniref:HNH endonuclease family protein n=2 Tax=Arthrobacter TaxID=1663 RepID=A0ABU9KFG2_9MICC|nr:HNH endonuclease family protein [Arthrobacter sp. YJM1]MDP5225626.1 HNH endonuclease family protein [Arthrobacter sp. YJM1]